MSNHLKRVKEGNVFLGRGDCRTGSPIMGGLFTVVILHLYLDYFLFFLLFIYFERGGDREKRRERIPSKLHAINTQPNTRLNLINCEI